MQLPAQLLQRRANSHKGDFGHIFILAGCLRFSGAALLCAEAALRTGVGLVTLGIPKGIANSVIRIKPKEIMLEPLAQTKESTLSISAYKAIVDFAKKTDILVLGPGLSKNKSTQGLIRKIIKSVNKPMVIDADGLNALAGHLVILQNKKDVILTPHPGEMSRLLDISIKEIQKDRKDIAKKLASRYNLTVVLKAHHTIVADKQKLYINKTGNPGMGTAGSGDVLTGMIAALLGQGLSAFEAAKFGVYLHGLAGDLAAEEKTQMGMIASDIITKIPEAIKLCNL